MRQLFLILSIFFTVMINYGQSENVNYKIFDNRGNPVEFDRVIEQIGQSNVVFLGEHHDDAVAHAFQLQIFKRAFEKYSANRKTVLSLEMFERDVQTVIDEYLKNQITETHFLAASRPWVNYKTDYRPLVEFARGKNIEIIAANTPRRYVNMVTRLGRASLNGLSPDAKRWLPPLPYAEAGEIYSKKFNDLMGATGTTGKKTNPMLDSQSLWDATMAFSIAEKLKTENNALIIHLNGSFHTENHLGTVEHLLKYNPSAKILVVTMRYEDDFKNFDQAKHKNLGDFIVLTDAKVPRSQK